MEKIHAYQASITWTGNRGEGTSTYRGYARDHEISIDDKPVISASSDPAFLGDKTKYNPEELLLASLSSCHMLWFLHLCADNGIVVTAYSDCATGTMEELPGGGRFTRVVLHPVVKITEPEKISRANELHDLAHKSCFIANSCNFPVTHEPNCTAGEI